MARGVLPVRSKRTRVTSVCRRTSSLYFLVPSAFLASRTAATKSRGLLRWPKRVATGTWYSPSVWSRLGEYAFRSAVKICASSAMVGNRRRMDLPTARAAAMMSHCSLESSITNFRLARSVASQPRRPCPSVLVGGRLV